MNKKSLLKILSVVVIAILIFSGLIAVCIRVEGARNDTKKSYTVNYETDGNGTLIGEATQTIECGGRAKRIKAVPNKGYRFLKWSDGVDTAIRYDNAVKNNIHTTAMFEIIKNTYSLNYNYSKEDFNEESVELSYGQLSETKLIIPTRERCRFDGWYADKEYRVKITDETGRFVLKDEEFFDLNCFRFYAKWVPDNDYTYKILLVYVTEINAELTKKDKSGTKQVNYKMTDTENQICHMTTEKISRMLNDLCLTNFKVDEYFTTIPLTKENISERSHGSLRVNEIDAYEIPEISNLINEYQSVLVVFSFDDYKCELSTGGGSAAAKFGGVHFDTQLAQLVIDRLPFTVLLDPKNENWNTILTTILHELMHTIEMRVNTFDWHTVEGIYKDDAYALYLSNQALVNGERVGVPYEFWEGKVANVYYDVLDNSGYIKFDYSEGKYSSSWLAEYEGKSNNGNLQYVIYGNDAVRVTAVPWPDYEFIGWSDGVMEASRKDLNLASDLHVIALFKRKSK